MTRLFISLYALILSLFFLYDPIHDYLTEATWSELADEIALKNYQHSFYFAKLALTNRPSQQWRSLLASQPDAQGYIISLVKKNKIDNIKHTGEIMNIGLADEYYMQPLNDAFYLKITAGTGFTVDVSSKQSFYTQAT